MEKDPRPPSRYGPTQLLRSAVNLAAELIRFRHADTGLHLDRVSRYAHLIAQTLPPTEGLNDEFIDDLWGRVESDRSDHA